MTETNDIIMRMRLEGADDVLSGINRIGRQAEAISGRIASAFDGSFASIRKLAGVTYTSTGIPINRTHNNQIKGDHWQIPSKGGQPNGFTFKVDNFGLGNFLRDFKTAWQDINSEFLKLKDESVRRSLKESFFAQRMITSPSMSRYISENVKPNVPLLPYIPSVSAMTQDDINELYRQKHQRHLDRLKDTRNKYAWAYENPERTDDILRRLRGRFLPSEPISGDGGGGGNPPEQPRGRRRKNASEEALSEIATNTEYLKSIPFIGGALSKFISNPLLLAGSAVTAGVGATLYTLNQSDNANKTVTNWRNAFNLFGKPSDKFTTSAYLAGMTDPSAMSQLYGNLNMRFGNADAILPKLGAVLSGIKDNRVKMNFAQAFGLDANGVVLAEIMSGKGTHHLTEDRITAARKAILDNKENLGWRSGSGFEATLESLGLSIPGAKSAKARYNPTGNDFWGMFSQSVMAYQGITDPRLTPTISGESAAQSNSVNITINGITFDGSAGLDTSLKDLLLQCGPEARNTLDAIDSRVR